MDRRPLARTLPVEHREDLKQIGRRCDWPGSTYTSSFHAYQRYRRRLGPPSHEKRGIDFRHHKRSLTVHALCGVNTRLTQRRLSIWPRRWWG